MEIKSGFPVFIAECGLMQQLTRQEIEAMNMVASGAVMDWPNDNLLSEQVAMVCAKTGVLDAKTLIREWGNFWFQLELAERGLVTMVVHGLEN
jgi:hypothetical protein